MTVESGSHLISDDVMDVEVEEVSSSDTWPTASSLLVVSCRVVVVDAPDTAVVVVVEVVGLVVEQPAGRFKCWLVSSDCLW